MAFFCTVSGVRIVAPGIAKCAGGAIPEYDATEVSDAAERVARDVIVTHRKSDLEAEPSPEAIKAAGEAALDVITSPAKPAGKTLNK